MVSRGDYPEIALFPVIFLIHPDRSS
jgi:hypothetical protein